MKDKKYSTLINPLSVFVGLLYMSWPVGYLVNPNVAFFGVASDLAVRSQPGWYIFLVSHGLLFVTVIVLSLILWRGSDRSRWIKHALVAYVLYGLFTFLSSVISLPCVSSSEVCDMTSRSYAHVIVGAIAIVFLTTSYIQIMKKAKRVLYKRLLQVVIFFSWVLAVFNTQLMLMGYSGVFIAVSQRLFLTGFALIAVAVPFVLQRAEASSGK